MGGGTEAAGDRDTKTAAGDGGTVSPERDGHPAGHATGALLCSALQLVPDVRMYIMIIFF